MASSDSKDRRDAGSFPGPNEDERRLRERLEKLLPEVVRRAINAGTSAVTSTEDGIRKLVSDFNLPRDVAAYLLMQASTSKDEVLRIIGHEVRGFLETVNLSGDFLSSARAGETIEATGEVTRAGGRLIYVRGLITADMRPALSFTSVITRVKRS